MERTVASHIKKGEESQTPKEGGINNHPPSLKQQFSVKCLDRKTLLKLTVFIITGKTIRNLSYSGASIL